MFFLLYAYIVEQSTSRLRLSLQLLLGARSIGILERSSESVPKRFYIPHSN